MFAHQVIEDLKLNPANLPKDELESIIGAIKISQKFHMGGVENLMGFLNHCAGKPMFEGELSVDIRLPYEVVWFDWIYEKKPAELMREGEFGKQFGSSKDGVLALEIGEKKIRVFCFSWIDYYKMWSIDAVGFDISIGDGIQVFEVWPDISKRESCDSLRNIIDNEDVTLGCLNSSLMFLSCKNIGTQKIFPPELLNKKRTKNGKTPLFTYHILYLKPTTQREKSIPQYLWNNRVHLCRGHFKIYTPEHLLFGKLTGRYWWQSQVRGDKKLGVVVKDYELKKVVNS